METILNTKKEIIEAVDNGKTVFCGAYKVIKDSLGQYLIVHTQYPGHFISLTGQIGTKFENKLNIQGTYYHN